MVSDIEQETQTQDKRKNNERFSLEKYIFSKIKEKKEAFFVPFFTIGDPSEEIFLRIMKEGVIPYADIIELGIPFSDPIADGPTIQKANMRALRSGVSRSNVFTILKTIRTLTDKPIVLLTYANIIGLGKEREEFLEKAKEVNVNGIIVADVPYKESQELRLLMEKYDIVLIPLITISSPTKTILEIAENSQGFLYLVSVKGVTGARDEIPKESQKRIQEIVTLIHNSSHPLPVFVGFGISSPKHIAHLLNLGVDGVIIGSALIKEIEAHLSSPQELIVALEKRIKELKKATCLNEKQNI